VNAIFFKMKNLTNLGVQELSIKEQKEVNGGKFWGKVYSNAHRSGGYWVHTVQVYRLGILVRTYDETFTPGNC